MSFLKSLFRRAGADDPPKAAGETEYKGYLIRAEPMKVGGEYQLAGTVERTVDGETRSHRLVRVDRFTTLEQAAEYTLAKGRQLVDEVGDGMFR